MTENVQLTPAFAFDAEGFFDGETMWQTVGGSVIKAPDSTDLCPWGDGEQDQSVFYRFVKGAWTTVKKPTSASELVGVVVAHGSMTMHDVELRKLIQKFSEEKGFHQVRGESLSWSIERDKEKTPEEKRADAERDVRAKRDSLIDETMWLVQRHQSEKMIQRATTLSDDQLMQLLRYHQALRDVPAQRGFPNAVVWPVAPDFVQ